MPQRTHGDSRTHLYGIWLSMRRRCDLPSSEAYPYYGQRGIAVCAAWSRYETFKLWATSTGYKRGLELDRRNNDGNYEPQNCRWVTEKVNARNRRSNVLVTAFNETKSLVEWSEDVRCIPTYHTLYKRIVTKGWSSERAITQTVRRRSTV